MTILSLINIFIFLINSVNGIGLPTPLLSKNIIDCKIGNDYILDCPIQRNKWVHPLIFQWYRSIDNYSIPIVSQFDDYPVHIDDIYRNKYNLFSNGSLKIRNTQLNDNYTYECRLIRIDRGFLDVKERYYVTLRVNEPPRFLNVSNSIIIAYLDSTVNFLCQTYGIPNPTVAWYKVISKDKQTIDDEDLKLLSVNSQNLKLDNVDDQSAGKYRCVSKNRLGSIENEFQLLIQGSIYWRHIPQNRTIKINESVTLKCEGESSEKLQYHWLKNNMSLSEMTSLQNRIRTFSDGVLIINNIAPEDHGVYVCVVSIRNSKHSRNKSAIISVKYPPMPSYHRQTNNITLIQGSLGICPCLLDAFPPIQSVAWYREGKPIRISSKGGAYSINSDYSLAIKSVENDDEGTYFCRAQNSEGFGRDSISFYVEVKEPIKFLSKPDSIYHVLENDLLVLPCVVYGNPQPTIKWYKNSIELNEFQMNLTLKSTEKIDHGLYICQASNKHSTINISTLVIVENTTPQAPLNIRYEQIASNIFLSWEPGYDGGRTQYFIIWYRMIQKRKQHWNQIRVLPENATDFLLFDLQVEQTYEITIVGENEYGLGTFSPIISVYLNNNEDLAIGYLQYTNETDLLRPLSPTDLYLSHSGSNLYITWNHPNFFQSPVNIHYYVIQWRSSIVFNNQQPQQFIVVEHPIRSYVLRDIKQAKYIIQIISYSDQGTYSIPIESEIDIKFNSILTYEGSNRLLISILCFLTILTIATICICIFCVMKCYFKRGSYCTHHKSNSKFTCGCCPSLQYGIDECSPIESDRYHTSLLKSVDLQSSPMYISRNRVTSQTIGNSIRSPSPLDSFTDSSISLARVTTIPRCRDSIASTCSVPTPQPTRNSLTIVSPTSDLPSESPINNDNKTTLLFQPISSADVEYRKMSSRLPLEAVPELSELSVANTRYSFTQSMSSSVSHPQHSSTTQPSPILITFDSSSLKRRS